MSRSFWWRLRCAFKSSWFDTPYRQGYLIGLVAAGLIIVVVEFIVSGGVAISLITWACLLLFECCNGFWSAWKHVR